MGGHPRGFLERGPAAEIIFDIASEFDEEALDPGFRNELHHVIDADERDLERAPDRLRLIEHLGDLGRVLRLDRAYHYVFLAHVCPPRWIAGAGQDT